ncbi:hypothetical protein [Rubellicoccus peritrichatus]|uniref:Uncharacterized protein n=1 Tax=Rubellicoccus peritrichatus TaxID=3080537 RepID=A0AAQ3L7R1_9BACT|nr:hypothetical protein [Puniceicoccus sp. CR14]WOO39414.1 hypothetical protein RZN69_12385 [Puniceicoccus sp. CR14]
MESENRKLITPLGALIDLAIAGVIFLVFMFKIIPPHVPVYDPGWKMFWSAYTSVVMAGFFFMAICLFHVTLADQLRRKREGIKD